jgi:hypothetical protein
LESVQLDNANVNPIYPLGDEVQTLEPWKPPETWAGVDKAVIKLILDTIAAGLADGNFYSAKGSAKDRQAWEVVTRFVPSKSESQAREIIKTWLKTGLLVEFQYDNPKTWKKVTGLKVDDTKRPT